MATDKPTPRSLGERVAALIAIAAKNDERVNTLFASLPDLRTTLKTELDASVRAELSQLFEAGMSEAKGTISAQTTAAVARISFAVNSRCDARFEALRAAEKMSAEQAEGVRVLLAQLQPKFEELSRMAAEQAVALSTTQREEVERIIAAHNFAAVPVQGITLKLAGRYEDGRTYSAGEVVTLNGSSFVAVRDGVTERPSGKSADWQLLAARGSGGPAGADADTSAFLLRANNLSDLADAATARDNLGLGTSDEVEFARLTVNGEIQGGSGDVIENTVNGWETTAAIYAGSIQTNTVTGTDLDVNAVSLTANISGAALINADSLELSIGEAIVIPSRITPPSSGVECVLKWGQNGSSQLAAERGTSESIEDRITRFGYRCGESPAAGDIRAYWQIEHRFQNAGDSDTEVHFSWFGPDGSTGVRPWQANISWGPGYATNGAPIGQITQAFAAKSLLFGTGGFDDQIVMALSTNEPDLYAWPKNANRDARIRVARYGGGDYLQMLAGGGGAYGGGVNNYLGLDSVSASLAANRGITFRRSYDSGATFSTLLNLIGNTAIPRLLFGPVTDDSSTENQFSGTVKSVVASSTTTGFTTGGVIIAGTLGNVVRLDGGTVGGNPGIWFAGNATTPSASNATITGSTSNTILNVPSGGTVRMRVANGDVFTCTSTAATFPSGVPVTISTTTESTSTTTGALKVTGGVGVAKRLTAAVVSTTGYTVATLPAGTVGDRAYVTDALAPTYLGALVGGGAIKCPVFYNGAAWVSA